MGEHDIILLSDSEASVWKSDAKWPLCRPTRNPNQGSLFSTLSFYPRTSERLLSGAASSVWRKCNSRFVPNVAVCIHKLSTDCKCTFWHTLCRCQVSSRRLYQVTIVVSSMQLSRVGLSEQYTCHLVYRRPTLTDERHTASAGSVNSISNYHTHSDRRGHALSNTASGSRTRIGIIWVTEEAYDKHNSITQYSAKLYSGIIINIFIHR